jgi:site-specific recombinase XerD
MPTEVGKIRREHVETYIEDQLARWKPATANNRRRSLAQLFAYLEDHGEILTSPMAKMKPPKVPEQQVPVLSDDELRALLKACDGREFEERRDPPPAQRVPPVDSPSVLPWLRSNERSRRDTN